MSTRKVIFRESNKVYYGLLKPIKEVTNEESYYILSEEERLALNVAIGKEGAVEAAKEREERKPEIGY